MMNEKKIMVFSEQRKGKIHPISFELLGKGREIADKLKAELSAVILGNNVVKEELMELIYHGADRVYLYDHPTFEYPDIIQYKHNIVKLIQKERPEIFLFGATHLGRSLAPRIAAAIGTGLTADCIDLYVDESGELVQVRPAFTGNILAYIKTRTRPIMCTVRYKAMKKGNRDTTRKGTIVKMETEILNMKGPRILEERKKEGLDITEAKIIVAGGKGLRSKEGFKLLEEFAELLGGVVGASRGAVDEGWIGKEHQVGFSGSIVKPKLYIACGISGALQHVVGMKDSEIVVAINSDPSAPIHKFADYSIVGDLYQVVPMFIKEIRAIKGEKS